MEFEYEKLKRLIDAFKVKHYGRLEFEGLGHIVFLSPVEDGVKGPAMYSLDSSLVNGGDIYLSESVPKDFRKSVLLHEIAEITALYNPSTGSFMDAHIAAAHQLASDMDLLHASSVLSTERLAQYQIFKKDALELAARVGQ